MSRRVQRALARLVPRHWRDSVEGDLDEDRRAREAAGKRATGPWMLRHGGPIVARLLVDDLRERVRARNGRARASNRGGWLHGAGADARYALRVLLRAPGFTALALATLALGIGLATAVFSLVDGVLTRPLPYQDADRIVRLAEFGVADAPPVTGGAVSDVLHGMLAQGTRTLSAVTHLGVAGRPVRTPGGAVLVQGAEVSASFFSIFPVAPILGRTFLPSDGDPAAPAVAVLSEEMWRTTFNGDPSVIGRTIAIQDVPREIVGVLPAAFRYPSRDVALWFPGRQSWPAPGPRQLRTKMQAIARLASGVTPAEAEAEINALVRQTAAAEAALSANPPKPTQVRVRRLGDDMGAAARPALLMLSAAVACVLLIASVNLAGLLLSRAADRQRELAMRAALGAARWRLMRPLLFESLWLGVSGGALGILLAALFLRLAPALTGADFPRVDEIGLDARASLIAVLVTSAVILLCGVGPATLTQSGVLRESLAAGRVSLGGRRSASSQRIRELLVVGQVSLAVALLIAAGLLGRSLTTLLSVDTGFKPDGVLTFQVSLPYDIWKYGDRQQRYYDGLISLLRQDGRVTAAGFSTYMPMHRTRSYGPIAIEGRPSAGADQAYAHSEVISDEYLRAIGLPIVMGRGFGPADTPEGDPVAIVNADFARMYLTDGRVLGRRVQFGRWLTIVGVVASKRHEGHTGETRAELYTPLRQTPAVFASSLGGAAGFAVRTSGDPDDLIPFVRQQVRSLDASSPIYNVMTLEDRIWQATARPRFYATVLGTFAALAMLTTIVGIFAVLSFSVQRRQRELGVRRALGATDVDILRLVVSRGGALIAAGLITGAGLAWMGSGLLRGLLFGVQVADPVTIGGVVAIVSLVGLAASYVPARRALGVEPVEILKAE